MTAPYIMSNKKEFPEVFVHESSYIDLPANIGQGTKIWHFCHISKEVDIGTDCVFGQNVYVGERVKIGNRVKVQNNVSIYTGCELEDEVFLGPSCVLTNVSNPRSQINRQNLYEKTLFKRGATVGANATIVCGVTIGRYAFIAAGSVVTKNVPDYALMVGNPARKKGWMSRHGHRLDNPDAEGIMVCPESGLRYQLEDNELKCLDLDEEAQLPDNLAQGEKKYKEFKNRGQKQ